MTEQEMIEYYDNLLEQEGLGANLDNAGANWNNCSFRDDKDNRSTEDNFHSETFNDYKDSQKKQIRDSINEYLPNILTPQLHEWYKLAYHTNTHTQTNKGITVDHAFIAKQLGITVETSWDYRYRTDQLIANKQDLNKKRLTKKESELIELLLKGLTRKEICAVLQITKGNLSARIKRLRDKQLIK